MGLISFAYGVYSLVTFVLLAVLIYGLPRLIPAGGGEDISWWKAIVEAALITVFFMLLGGLVFGAVGSA